MELILPTKLLKYVRRGNNKRNKIRFRHGKKDTNGIFTKFKIGKDFCRLIGYYLAEGCITNDRTQFSFNIGELNFYQDVENILNKSGFKTRRRQINNVMNILCDNRFLSSILKELDCGDTSLTKKVPDIIYNLSQEHKIELLKGYFRGDGSVDIRDGRANISCTSVSSKLIYGINFLLLDLDILPTFKITKGDTCIIEGRTVNCNDAYHLTISEQHNIDKISNIFGRDRTKKIKNKRKPIQKIKSSAYKYNSKYGLYEVTIKSIKDVGMEKVCGFNSDYQQYITNHGILTHNCFPKDINALIQKAIELDVSPLVLLASWEKNLEVRKKRDWEK